VSFQTSIADTWYGCFWLADCLNNSSKARLVLLLHTVHRCLCSYAKISGLSHDDIRKSDPAAAAAAAAAAVSLLSPHIPYTGTS
jgi:hypothetical protein